jgi:UDP-N-acetylglucosamine 4,6-dehydratase (inverting)
MLSGSSILITGGTGSFGRAMVRRLLERHDDVERIVVFSRDELKQHEMRISAEFQSTKIRFFLGDIRDGERVRRAFEGVDVVIHAAALKQVPAAEYNPFEFIKTNVLGAQNVIDACLDRDVRRVVALSTDKAAAPINLYGATKLCSDKLFTAANQLKGRRDLRFSVVRYGNVMGSRGSVIPFFLKERFKGVLPITDPGMTRFNITLSQGVDLVIRALDGMWGGEIFVPKIPSYRLDELATAIGPECRHEVIGTRPGEKLHEEMVTTADAAHTVDVGDRYVILPHMPWWNREDYISTMGATTLPRGFAYDSGTNTEWLSVDALRTLIREHVDPTFIPGQPS